VTDDQLERLLNEIRDLKARVRTSTTYIMLMLLAAIVAIANNGCVTSPMAEFREDVVTECEAAREYLSRDCAIPIDEPPCGAEVAETDRCMGLQEAVYQCWQGVSVYCAPWGPDVGSQCDEPEWALRTCLWPELAT